MPLYEYKCEGCGKRVEILQRFSDKSYTHCPNCGGNMKKLISSGAIQFKGSGFHKTDYANKPVSTGESKSESKNESKSESKSDSTPATKPDKSSD